MTVRVDDPQSQERAGEAEAPRGDANADARADASAEARKVGRGGLAVLGAKVYFVLAGLVQQTLLPRAIGLAGYGALARVLAVANVLNNVVVASSTQGVSRTVARAGGEGPAGDRAFRGVWRVHVPIAIVLAAGFALAAPAVGAFEDAPHIVLPLEVVAGVVLLYGLYAPLIGALNGRAQFTRQAALDTAFATLRTAGLIGVGWLFVVRWGAASGVTGACAGFVAAAVCIVPLALRWAGIGRSASSSPAAGAEAGRASVGGYLLELLPLAGAQAFTNVLMQSDITVLGRFLSLSSGGETVAADEWVGVYRACQLFAFLPFQLVLSITQILFPMVARAKAAGDLDAVRTYVGRGARLAALTCGLFVVVVAAMPESVLRFAYGANVAARGAATLRVLALGQGAFTMMAVGTIVLASLGRELRAMLLTLATACVSVAACWIAASGAPFGEAQLRSTAVAVSAALAVGLVGAAALVTSDAKAFVPWKTALRVPLVVAVGAVAGTKLPVFGKLVTPFVALGVAGAYVATLVVLGELGRDDVAVVKSLRGRAARKA